MNNKEYAEFSESLHKIKDNLVSRRKKLYRALDDFQKIRPLTFDEHKEGALSATLNGRDFIDVTCYPEKSEGPVLECGFQDIDGDYIKSVSPLMMENGKQRILKAYKFAFELLNEQITEVEEEIIRMEAMQNA